MSVQKLPHCPGVNQADVWHVAQQFKPQQIVRWYNVDSRKAKAWLSGEEPMPKMLYELLAFRVCTELPSTAGHFAHWRVIDGKRLDGPGISFKGGLSWIDIDRLNEYRRLDSLASRQTDLIEKLMRERDFYKRQCELETRHGLMLRSIFEGKPGQSA